MRRNNMYSYQTWQDEPKLQLQFNEKGFLQFKQEKKPVFVLSSVAYENEKPEKSIQYFKKTKVNISYLGGKGVKEHGPDIIVTEESSRVTLPKKITLEHKETPHLFPFDPYEAYKIRIVNFANGAIYAIRYDSSLNEEEKQNRIKKIKDLLEEKITRVNQFKEKMEENSNVSSLEEKTTRVNQFKEKMKVNSNVSFSTELYQFYNEDLPKASGLKAKHIALGEAMYVWQEIPRIKRETIYTRWIDENDTSLGHLVITQIDEPRISELTENQKIELRKIFFEENYRPQWFNALPPFARNALLDLLTPLSPDEDCNWKNYEKCHPTILRHIPGEANATTHRLIVSHVKADGTEIVLSKTVAVRQGAPTSFDMKDKLERQTSAEENLSQMLSKKAIDTARKEFKTAWGIQNKSDEEYKLPILLGGLLTSWEQANYKGKFVDGTGLSGGSSNSLMAREKSAAIAVWKTEEKDIKNVELFDLNVGINNHRNGVVKPDKKFIEFSENFSKKILDRLLIQQRKRLEIKKIKKLDETAKKLHRLNGAIKALKALDGKKSKYKGRNENLYTAALYDATTRLMYGYDTGNCKSSKDRKGVEFLMADAMLVYLAEQEARGIINPVFPGINDTGVKRERFVKIFCELYASGHQLLIAHDNSPGSPGIKDEGILDKDIIKELQRMGDVYAQSKKLADSNKPGSFWKKHRSKMLIGLGVLVGIAIVGGAIASGVLAPLGIISAALAIQITAGTAAAPVAAGTLIGLRQIKEVRTDHQNSFSAQEEIFAKKQKKIKEVVASPAKKNMSYEMSSIASNFENIDTKEKKIVRKQDTERDAKVKQKIISIIHNICDTYLDKNGTYKDENNSAKTTEEFIYDKIMGRLSYSDQKQKSKAVLFQPMLLQDIRPSDLNRMIFDILVNKYTQKYQQLASKEAKDNKK